MAETRQQFAARLDSYDPYFEASAKKYGLDPKELKAIAYVEHGDPSAANSVGAQGIMQVMPVNTKGVKDPYDPATNIDLGAKVLADNYTYFQKAGVKPEDLQRAAWAGYNRSREHVLRDYKANGEDGSKLDAGTDHNSYVSSVASHYSALGGDGPRVASGGGGGGTSPVAELSDMSRAAGGQGGWVNLKTLPNGTVPFRDNLGRTYTVPAEKAADEYRRGNEPVDTDEYAKQAQAEYIHQKYGTGIGNALKAAGESLLDIPTFGAGRGMLVSEGIEPAAEVKEHEASYAGTQGLTTAAGLVAQHLAGVGEAKDVVSAAQAARAAEAARALEGGAAVGGALEAGKAVEAGRAADAVSGGAAVELKNNATLPEFNFKPGPKVTSLVPEPTPVEDADILSSEAAKATPPRPPPEAYGSQPLPPDFSFDPDRGASALDSARAKWAGAPEVKPEQYRPLPVSDADIQASAEAAPTPVSDADILSSEPARPAPGMAARAAFDAAQAKGPEAVRDAYSDVRKVNGKEFADSVLNGEGATAGKPGTPPAMADLEEATNAKGGPNGNLYTPEGVAGGEAAPANVAKNGVATGTTLPEFQLPARPAGISEPLPPEQTAELPNPGAAEDDALSKLQQMNVQPPHEPLLPDLPEPPPDATNGPVPQGTAGGGAAGGVSQPSTAPRAPFAAPSPAAPGGLPPPPPGGIPPGGVAPLPPPPPLPPAQVATIAGQAAAATARAAPRAFSPLSSALVAAGESVPWTVGNNYTQATLDHEPITAERLLAGGLQNALLSGGLGAAFGLAAKGLRKLDLAFQDIAGKLTPEERLRNWKGALDNVRDGTKTFSKAVYQDGLKYARFSQILGNRAEIVSGRAPMSWTNLVADTDAALSNLSGRSAAARELTDAWGKFDAARRTATTDAQVMEAADRFKQALDDAHYESPPGTTSALEQKARGLAKQWRKELVNPATFGPAADFQKGLNSSWHDLLMKDAKRSPIFEAFMRKGMIGAEGDRVFDERKLAAYIKQAASDAPSHQAAAELRGQILSEWLKAHKDYVDVLRKGVYEPLGLDHEIAGFHSFLGADDAQVAKAMQDMQDMSAGQKKGFLRKTVGSTGFRYGAAFSLMAAGVPHAFMATWGVSTLLNHLMGLGSVEPALAAHGAKFTAHLNSLVDDVFKAGSMGAGAVGVFNRLQITPNKADEKERRQQAAQSAAHVVALANDPELPQKLAAGTGMLNAAAPDLAVQVQTQAMRAVQYLAAQAPKDPLQPSPLNRVPYVPSHAETSRWENVAEVAHDPSVLLSYLRAGSVTHEQVATALAVYPELLGQMRQLVQERLPEHGKELNYRQQQALAVFLGHPVDWSSQPDAPLFLQRTFAMPTPGTGDMSKGGAANMKKPRPPNSAKQATMVAEQVQSGLQGALEKAGST